MNRRFSYTWLLLCGLLVVVMIVGGCDLVDPTGVRNPQTTEKNLEEGATGATTPFLQGVKLAFSDMIDTIAYYTDCVSDNYDNVATYISPLVDKPRSIRSDDLTLNHTDYLYFSTQECRALATFTIDVVVPNDAEVMESQIAELYFYRGMANLCAAENFVGCPVEENGEVLQKDALLDLAIADFLEAATHNENEDMDFQTRIDLALARAYRYDGDETNAVAKATEAIAGTEGFVYFAEFDAATFISWSYVFGVSRNLHDMQPLPRLDFLDPKYTERGSSIPVLKMEEAHLILAEAALVDGNAASAAQHLGNAIALAQSRPTTEFLDEDPRDLRPAGGTVQASPTAPAIDGLIFPREGATVYVPYISGCSLNADEVVKMTDANALHKAIYLARQEIFIFEGRRMNDLGILLPMMKREWETNPNINEGDVGTLVSVPSYIPADDDLDAFTIGDGNTVIEYDMNQVIADNGVSPLM